MRFALLPSFLIGVESQEQPSVGICHGAYGNPAAPLVAVGGSEVDVVGQHGNHAIRVSAFVHHV